MLLEHCATEGEWERQRWPERKAADECDTNVLQDTCWLALRGVEPRRY